MIWSNLHTEDQQVVGATVQHLVPRRPGSQNLCGPGLDYWRNDRLVSRQGRQIFPLLVDSVQADVGPTRPPNKWVPATRFQVVKQTTHFCLVPRLRMRGAIPPLSHVSSRRAHVHLYPYLALMLNER